MFNQEDWERPEDIISQLPRRYQAPILDAIGLFGQNDPQQLAQELLRASRRWLF